MFFVVKTQVFLMDPLSSIYKVHSLVIQEESNNSASFVPHTDDNNFLINVFGTRKPRNLGKGFYGGSS